MTISTAVNAQSLLGEQIDRLQAEPAGDRGGEAVVAVEHVAPDRAGRDVGEHVGQEEDHPERHRAGDPSGDRQRDGERERQLDEQRDGDDEAVVDERAGEDRIVEHVAVVLQADEPLGPAVAVPVVEAVPGRLGHRQRDENGEQQQRRRQEDESDRPTVGGHPSDGFEMGLSRPSTNERASRVGTGSPAAHRRRGASGRLYSSPLLLLGGLLNCRGGRFGRHLAGGDGDRDVIDDPADRGTEILIEIILVVGRRGEIVGQAPLQRIGDRRLRRPSRRGCRRRWPRPPWRISPG